ncbi:MAG: 2-oxoacid:acceptor oxidoreductase subunit alpha [Candidatus Aenigmarchaeota archaeon]|nr:2-oxoacid:acceptor oxidoreductase subunit alpha [Candidatus Aenigmarchaeota archaeon]
METILNNFSWKIAGVAGDGILNAGLMLAKCAIRGGLWSFATAEYPSLIRGGHNHLDVRISESELFSHTSNLNLLVALNQESIDKHASKLTPGGGIIFDADAKLDTAKIGRTDINLYPIPLLRIAEESGSKIMRNVVAMGATLALTDLDIELFNSVLRDNFGKKKGTEIVDSNKKALKAGYDYAREKFGNNFKYKIKPVGKGGKLFMSGNEAICAGAIKAGLKFFSAYPMTPASSLLHTMASFEKDYNLVVKHTEDEIAAMNMAIGANFAGVRAMTATSGGGFALMVEAFGLAAQTETPLVVVDAMRPGPATGMATHSGQGDLRFVLHAAPDDFPRIVLAPGTVDECFSLTFQAFNLAEKYQLPVVILTDKYLGESFITVNPFNTNLTVDRGLLATDKQLTELSNNGGYLRYKVTNSGVSLRSRPGQQFGEHVASSYEHDEEGYEREEEDNKIKMAEKRFRKLEQAEKEIPQPSLIGPSDADLTIVGWGSTKGSILEAMKTLEKEGTKTNYLQITFISPFPADTVERILKSAKNVVIVEGNQTAQMASVIREHTGFKIENKILKFTGRPFSPEELTSKLKEVIAKNKIVSSYSTKKHGWY